MRELCLAGELFGKTGGFKHKYQEVDEIIGLIEVPALTRNNNSRLISHRAKMPLTKICPTLCSHLGHVELLPMIF